MQESDFFYMRGTERTDVHIARHANRRLTGTLTMGDGSQYPFMFESGTVLELLVGDHWVVHYPGGPSGLYDTFAGAYGRWKIQQVA